jgi:hypothetical protein
MQRAPAFPAISPPESDSISLQFLILLDLPFALGRSARRALPNRFFQPGAAFFYNARR